MDENSQVESSLDIFDTVSLDSYFSTEYSFQISRGQTCTWTLSSPECQTLTAGEYCAAGLIFGCGGSDDADDYQWIWD